MELPQEQIGLVGRKEVQLGKHLVVEAAVTGGIPWDVENRKIRDFFHNDMPTKAS